MNSWLQNIKGQITELATEVLNDATEEGQVSASSELQVEKKKCAEAERHWLSEKAKNEALDKQVKELEEQLFNSNLENDAIKEKFMGIVGDREQQIKRLNWEIERFRCSSEEGEFKSVNLEGSPPKMGPLSSNVEAEKAMAKLKERHECEVAAIIAANASNIQQIRAEYERRIHELESSSVAATENEIVTTDKAADAKQNELIGRLQREIAELQKTVEQLDELKEERERLNVEKTKHLEEIKQLKTLNNELMTLYNETSAKLDELKNSGEGAQSETVVDLSNKISSLKSMLNETESRYELCKMDQAETANRLEILLKEFADLRSSTHAAQATAEGNERELTSEMHSLRTSLEHAKADREKLVIDFRESVRVVGEELAELKEYNQRLVNENGQMHESLSQLNVLRDALNSNNDELSNFRKKFSEMQDGFTKEIERISAERDELQNQLDLLNNCRHTQGKVTDERQSQTDERKALATEEQIAEVVELNKQLKAELNEREEELHRLHNDKLLLADISTTDGGHCKRPPSDTDSAASNNDWERMGKEDIEVEGVSSSAASEAKEPSNRRKKSTELSDSSTQTDKTQFDEEHFKERLALLDEEMAKANDKCQQMEMDLSHAKVEISEGMRMNEHLEEQIAAKNSVIGQMKREIESFEAGQTEHLNRIETLQLACENQRSKFTTDCEDAVLLRSETEKLQELLKQKHSECQNYYEKLQAMDKILEGKGAKLESAEETLRRREKEIALDRERIAKLEGDLQRLREHLLTMEEHSSKDAIAAEERETELRRQIRILREKSTTEGTSLTNSLEQHQFQVRELHANVALLEEDKRQMATMLTEKDEMLAEMSKSLSDLQSVLKELADDQKMDRQKSDAELWNIREALKQKTHALREMEEAKANLEDEFASITHELNLTREQLLMKDNLVEELENQVEDMRIAGGKHHSRASAPSVVGIRNGAAPSHKIDDATLRQLFLSYFLADKSKQPEIAIVMSRILGYSAEEQSQISVALSKLSSSSASSWFAAPFSASSSASPGPSGGGISLTEQFVRFLEQESMANSRALVQPPLHQLLLPTTAADSGGTFLVGESPPVPTHSSSSSADLKSMLEQ